MDDASLYAQLLEKGQLIDSCAAVDCGDARYDRILIRSSEELSLSVRSWSLPEGFEDGAGEPLSDHEPVEVVLDWRVEP